MVGCDWDWPYDGFFSSKCIEKDKHSLHLDHATATCSHLYHNRASEREILRDISRLGKIAEMTVSNFIASCVVRSSRGF